MSKPTTPPAGPLNVTLPNPDDPSGSPLYDGPVNWVHDYLIPGEYHGHTDNDDPVVVTVAANTTRVIVR